MVFARLFASEISSFREAYLVKGYPMSNVYVRITIYILSPVLATIVQMIPGWGVAYADGILTIDVNAVIAAVVGGLGISAGIFAKFGVK